ncbi:alpha/beta hydrolase [Neptunicella marina]|uniref:Dienelactone hydrolase family protein n=1 Tax=Neptunicella marina TaxID=2125989 RepID=A0A8J6IS66_9ALTE|nr:dienelactone hydrolase family protein [Neptunicella marina]MBC3766480.1 dienelactone hydrolase family protein [Neptunicella marina]
MSQTEFDAVVVESALPAKNCVIWLHGLGDSGQGFAPIVPELNLPNELAVKFIFPNAPVRPVTINNGYEMRAWYDIKSLQLESRADAQGVLQSSAHIQQLIEQQITQGITAENIVLAGFSQGGVITLHLAPRLPYKLAGVLALSTYMAEPKMLSTQKHNANQNTPILMCHGSMDDVVPLEYGRKAYQTLSESGYQVKWQEYAMGHSLCQQQIAFIRNWLLEVLS